MNLSETISQLSALPIPERLQLVESLWNSIEADTPVTLSPAEQEELDRRLAAHEAEPEALLTWDQVTEKLRMDQP